MVFLLALWVSRQRGYAAASFTRRNRCVNEAYLDGHWYTFDPRNNVSRIARIPLARGRDAADVAMTTTFVPNTLYRFRVWTDEIAG